MNRNYILELEGDMSGEVRPEVMAFARLMEAKLRENDSKGTWKHCTTEYLSRRCGNELKELRAVVTKRNSWKTPVHVGRGLVVDIGREAADVANFAMMIADVCGALS